MSTQPNALASCTSDKDDKKCQEEIGQQLSLHQHSESNSLSESEIRLARTICKLSVSKGARDYTPEEYQTLHDCFLELGDIYVAKKAYTKAVALYNMSLRVAVEKLKSPPRVVRNIEWKILNAEQQFLGDVLKEKAPILNHVAHQTQIKSYKAYLEQFREATRQALKHAYEEIQKVKDERGSEEAEKKKVELIRGIFKNIAAEIKSFVQILLKDCFEVLGEPPCGYAIVGLGSLAREEATPYSDFEFAILISEEGEGGKNKEYFRHLTDLLHLKVINLGETIIPAMAIESLNPTHGRSTDFFFDDITPRGFAFDGAMPQACKTPHGKKDADGKVVFELIQTPDKMAAYHGKEKPDGRYWFEVDSHLTFALANVVCLDGDEALVGEYQKKMWEVLNQTLDPKYAKELGEQQYLLGQYIALKLIKENSRDFDPYLNKSEDMGKLFDAKKDLYRIPNLIIDALSLFYRLKHFGDSGYKLEKLCAHDVLKSEAIEKLKWVLMETMRFRLDTYLHYKAQKEQMNPLLNYFMVKTAILPSKDLKHNLDNQFAMGNSDFESLNKIYQVLIPLQDSISELIRGDDRGLKGLRFKEINLFIQGRVFVRLLQYSKAIESFQSAWEKSVKLYGGEHIDVASSYNNLGAAWHALGDAKKAVEYLDKALAIWNKLYEQEHPDVGGSYFNLGNAWQTLGDAKKAVECFDKALAILIKVYGPEHHDVAKSYSNLGLAWQTLGDAKKAIGYLEKALAIWINLYGPEHSDVAKSYNNLGEVCRTLGYASMAVEYHEKSLVIWIKAYGGEHPYVAISFNNLGLVWQALGDAKKAVEYHEKALGIRIKFYGAEHPDIANSYNSLGTAWHTLGDDKKAVEYLDKALMIRIGLYGPEHPYVATSFNNLGLVWQTLGDGKKAIEYFEKALVILIKVYNPEHPNVAKSYNNLGAAALEVLGDAKKAIEYFEKALVILTKVYNPEHPDVASSYNNLGAAWHTLGDAKKTVEFYNKALVIRKKCYGAEHPDVAGSYNNLGVVSYALGDAKKAVEYFENALKILSPKYDSNHPILSQIVRDRNFALQFLQKQANNQKEVQQNNNYLAISLTASSRDYIRRLQFVLNESIVQIDRDERTVSFPVSWLRQLSDGAISELSRELQDNKHLPTFKRKL